MTNSPEANALARLGQIADLGYSILTNAPDGSIAVLASNHSPNWTAKDFSAWLDGGDTLMSWLSENLGSVTVSDLDTGPLAKACLKLGPTSISCDLFAGLRLKLILSHSKGVLDATDMNEARAAAILLQMHHESDATFAIAAKELIYLEQVSTGATDDEIAAELQLSLRAVKERKRKAIDDLNAKNIGHATGIAKLSKLI